MSNLRNPSILLLNNALWSKIALRIQIRIQNCTKINILSEKLRKMNINDPEPYIYVCITSIHQNINISNIYIDRSLVALISLNSNVLGGFELISGHLGMLWGLGVLLGALGSAWGGPSFIVFNVITE